MPETIAGFGGGAGSRQRLVRLLQAAPRGALKRRILDG
jgi:hypothetical protein